MKFLIAILSVVAFASAEYTDEEKEMWQAFKLEHGKLFLSPGKEKDRMENFLKNAKGVKEHNEAFQRGEALYEAGLHEFSDLSEEAFLARFGGAKMLPDTRTVDPNEDVTLRQTLPISVNLTEVMGPDWTVRYQRNCGSCWAFSAGACIESAYFNKYGVLVDVSEQQMVDCTYKTLYNKTGSCAGGNPLAPFNYIALNGGVALESDYPYTGIEAGCNTTIPRAVFLGYQYTNNRAWKKVKNNDDIIKTALNEQGVLSVCADTTGLGKYRSGVFVNTNYNTPLCKHFVALVGYGFDSATGAPYWTIRNSWGSTWFGEGGYARLYALRHPETNNNYGGLLLDTVFYPIIA